MPKLGESVTEGTITTWLVKEGDYVNKYDPIAEVMTDKVNAEVPSSYSGTIKEIVVKEGDTVAVGELICYIEVTDKSEKSDSLNDQNLLDIEEQHDQKKVEINDSMKLRYSPAVLRLASEHEIDLEEINGTGFG